MTDNPGGWIEVTDHCNLHCPGCYRKRTEGRRARKLGFKSVIVLGHAAYYPRFGFEPASRWGIRPPFEVPDDVFMALELVRDGLKDIQGTVEYPPEFNDV